MLGMGGRDKLKVMRPVSFGLNSILGSLLALLPAPCSYSQPHPTLSPVELVQRAVQNELAANKNAARFMFQDQKKTPRGAQTKLMVETRDSMVAIIVANDGQPLTPEQHQAEMARVERFLKNPEELRRKQRQEKEDAQRVARIIKALPQAFLYEYGDPEVGRAGVGKTGDPLMRLNFRPNPNYEPPSHVEQVLVGMEGYLLIDGRANRIARIDGRLAKDVSFGWGILGHLDRGGHFLVEQGEVCAESWRITRLDLAVTGKVLLFKSVNIQSNETFTGFRPVPSDLNFAQGLELLKKQEAVLAENGLGGGHGKQK